MHQAASTGHLQVVNLLLLKGVEVDSRDEVSTYNNVMYCVIVIEQSVCSIVPYTIKHSTFQLINNIHYVGTLSQFPHDCPFCVIFLKQENFLLVKNSWLEQSMDNAPWNALLYTVYEVCTIRVLIFP